MRDFGHKSLVACDATFGTNKYKYHLFTLMVFDSFSNGIPVTWIITSGAKASDMAIWLNAINEKMKRMDFEWKPNAFIVDNADAEINAIRMVWGASTPILLCLWHVRRCWLNHSIKKTSNKEVRHDIMRRLGEVMYMGTFGKSILETFEDAQQKIFQIFRDYPNEVKFNQYFMSTWMGNMDMWIKATREYPHAGQDTNSAIESYHGFMKQRQALSKKTLKPKRLDWLIWMLTEDLAGHYWYIDFLKRQGHIKNIRRDELIRNMILRSKDISIDDVIFPTSMLEPIFVSDRSHGPNVRYSVYHPDTEWASCTCTRASQTNICKHILRALHILAGLDDSQLLRVCVSFYETLNGGNWCFSPSLQNDESMIYLDDLPDQFTPVTTPELEIGTNPPSSSGTQPTTKTLSDELTILQDLVKQNPELEKYAVSKIQKVHIELLELKERLQSDVLHPSDPLTKVVDDWGVSMKRKKPLVELICKKKK